MKWNEIQKKSAKFIARFVAKKYKYTFVTDVPGKIKENYIYIIQDGKEPDAIAFNCPCGCKKIIHLNLLKDMRPCWSFVIHKKQISLYPSIRAKSGCKSHFWVTNNKVEWSKYAGY